MQRPEDRPPKTGRPSLLSAEQQAEADRHRILSTLDGKTAAADKGAPAQGKKRRPMLLWGTAGVGLIAAAAGALAWMDKELDDKTVSMSAAVLPAPSAPVASAPAAPALAAAAAASSAPAEAEVSTAAILNDAPAAPAESKLPSLNEMLSAPSPAAHTGQKTAQLAEQKSEHKPEHKSEHKAEHKAEPVRLAQKAPAAEHKPKATEKARYKPVPAPAPDSDVTLLAALMAHMQTPSKKADSPAAQLKLCKQQNAAGEEQCRVRLCAGAARNEPECKSPPIAKASADS